MAITDELRKWWVRKFPVMDSELHKDFTAIAGRIDAEHEREIGRAAQLLADAEKDRDANYANWQDCKQKVLQHNITMDELSAEIEHLKDELAHRIELPKDADGEVIHVGDELHDEWHEQNQGEVEWLMLDRLGWWLMFKNNCERFYVHEFHEWRHRHTTTVEDVLRDMHAKLDEVTALYVGEAIDSDERDSDEARIFAEYAAKLRLAGDAE